MIVKKTEEEKSRISFDAPSIKNNSFITEPVAARTEPVEIKTLPAASKTERDLPTNSNQISAKQRKDNLVAKRASKPGHVTKKKEHIENKENIFKPPLKGPKTQASQGLSGKKYDASGEKSSKPNNDLQASGLEFPFVKKAAGLLDNQNNLN